MSSSHERPGPGAAPLDARNEDAPSDEARPSVCADLDPSALRVMGLDGIVTADRLRLLETQEIAGIGSWDWYVEANVVVWTPELYRIHGLDADGFGGSYEAFIELVHPDDRAHAQQVVLQAMETCEPFLFEHRILLPTGEERTLESRGRCVVDPNGSLIKLTGTCQDVTDELRSREELRHAHERYRSLIEAIPAISYIDSLRPAVQTLFVSPQISDILGYDAADVTQGFWAGKLHPDDRDEVISSRRRAYGRGEDFSCEYRVVAADGRTVWIRDQAAIVRDDDGNPIFAQGIMYDISERKRLEDQLAQSQKMDALGRLAGGIAHDFNNLLTAIIGNAQLLLDDGDPPAHEVRSGLLEVREAALLGADLVDQLLGFTRTNEGPARVVDLNRIVASTQGLLRRVIGEDVSLVTNLRGGSLPVRIEQSQLSQVIVNLVVNAREAIPDGGRIVLDVFRVDSPEGLDEGFTVGSSSLRSGDGYAALRVVDSGGGIEEELLPLVFEPFFTTKTRGSDRGTGLGLATVYAIVTRAGGSITVSRAPGSGAAITVLLPLQAASVDDDVIILDRTAPETSGGCVLVVEDDDRVRRITASLLTRSGFEVFEAPDGTTGLAVALERDIDVLLTDVVMPGMDGKTLAVRVLEEKPDVAIVFMSGYAEQLELSDVSRPGIGYLQKPFTREELDAKLGEVARTKRREPT